MPGLAIHTSNRLEVLLDALAKDLAAAPLPPLQPETIVVPGQGMARWLTLGLCERHGVAATLELAYPGAFLQRLGGPGELTPYFERGALLFRIFALLGDPERQRVLGPAARYCQDDADQHKRFQLAERLALCFDDYQLYRDAELLQWERELPPAGAGPHARWQAQLWRALLAEFSGPTKAAAAAVGATAQQLLFGDTPAPTAAGAHRLQRVRDLLRDPRRAQAALPPRVSVFGLSTLPPAFLQLLQQIADHVPVRLYLQKPTPDWFGDVVARRGERRGQGDGHPLLAQWGAQSRELFDALLDLGADEQPLAFPDPGTGTLLHTLQSDLLHLRVRGAGGDVPPQPLLADDASLTVHGAHSPLRELEIVRDQILAAFAAEPSLRPADVVVLVPDVQEYAPYVHAVFDPVQKLLPFQVADRSPAAELPVAAAFLRLCALGPRRFAAPEVLLLLEEPALARTFGITRSDLGTLRAWVQRTAIRWGLDGNQRQRDCELPPTDANSWRQGVRRLLLGQATGAVDALVAGVLPAGDSTFARSELLGRFADFVQAMAAAGTELLRAGRLEQWADTIDRTVARMFTAEDDDERLGVACLERAAARLRELARLTHLRDELQPSTFRRWLEGELQGQGENRGFLTGAITVAAMQPMRALPAAMVCVCGLADGSFPRRDRRASFDLLATERRRLDRNARSDDRQLFLDVLLAARRRLLLTWISHSSKDNSECAPSPVLSELLEHVDQAFLPPAGSKGSASQAITVQHPLQSWSPRYGGDADPRLFTYAAPARTPAIPAAPREPVPAAAPAGEPERIALRDLLDFWRHPVRWYGKQVLLLRLPGDDDRDDDSEPFTLHSLDKYRLQDDSVQAQLAARPDPSALALAIAGGCLPPGALGRFDHRELRLEVERFLPRLRAELAAGTLTLQLRGADYLVHGELDGIGDHGLLVWRTATLKPKDKMRAWVHHVALCAAADQGSQVPRATLLLGKEKAIAIPSLSPALPELDCLVAGFRRGRQSPLPVFAASSHEFAESMAAQGDQAAARRAARREFRIDKPWAEERDPWISLFFRDQDPLQLPEFDTWAMATYGRVLGFVQGGA